MMDFGAHRGVRPAPRPLTVSAQLEHLIALERDTPGQPVDDLLHSLVVLQHERAVDQSRGLLYDADLLLFEQRNLTRSETRTESTLCTCGRKHWLHDREYDVLLQISVGTTPHYLGLNSNDDPRIVARSFYHSQGIEPGTEAERSLVGLIADKTGLYPSAEPSRARTRAVMGSRSLRHSGDDLPDILAITKLKSSSCAEGKKRKKNAAASSAAASSASSSASSSSSSSSSSSAASSSASTPASTASTAADASSLSQRASASTAPTTSTISSASASATSSASATTTTTTTTSSSSTSSSTTSSTSSVPAPATVSTEATEESSAGGDGSTSGGGGAAAAVSTTADTMAEYRRRHSERARVAAEENRIRREKEEEAKRAQREVEARERGKKMLDKLFHGTTPSKELAEAMLNEIAKDPDAFLGSDEGSARVVMSFRFYGGEIRTCAVNLRAPIRMLYEFVDEHQQLLSCPLGSNYRLVACPTDGRRIPLTVVSDTLERLGVPRGCTIAQERV